MTSSSSSSSSQARFQERFAGDIEESDSSMPPKIEVKDFFILPNEIIVHIFSFLSRNEDIARASMVSRQWKVLIDSDVYLKRKQLGIEVYVFGKVGWKRCFGDIGTEPPLL